MVSRAAERPLGLIRAVGYAGSFVPVRLRGGRGRAEAAGPRPPPPELLHAVGHCVTSEMRWVSNGPSSGDDPLAFKDLSSRW